MDSRHFFLTAEVATFLGPLHHLDVFRQASSPSVCHGSGTLRLHCDMLLRLGSIHRFASLASQVSRLIDSTRTAGCIKSVDRFIGGRSRDAAGTTRRVVTTLPYH